VRYKINKGSNSSRLLPGITFCNSLAYIAKFDYTCEYLTQDPNNQDDINKLFGFTEGLRHVHDVSARFGWRWNPTIRKIEILAYVHTKVGVQHIYLHSLSLGEEVSLEIIRYNNKYEFRVADNIIAIVYKSIKTNPLISFKLRPYFGGDETAPHTMYIYLKRV
jgi:hypothetical protein